MKTKSVLALGLIAVFGFVSAGDLLCGDALMIDRCDSVKWEGTVKPALAQYQPPCGEARPAVRFHGPCEASMSVKLDLAEMHKIALRVVANAKCRPTICFNSEPGSYRCEFEVLAGEQVALLPLGSFKRDGVPLGWEKIDSVVLTLPKEAGKASIDLLSMEALPEDVVVTGEELFLLRPVIPRVYPLGAAWPLYAILSETQYPPRSERSPGSLQKYLNEMFGVELPVNPEGMKATPGIANVILMGKEVGLAAGTVTQAELDRQGYGGFVLRADSGSITIAGQSRHGVGCGTYRFLEEQGCRFFAYACKTIPKKTDRVIPVCDLADKPFFEGPRFRGWYWNYAQSSLERGAPAHAETKEEFERLFEKGLSWGWTEHTAGYLVPKKIHHDEHPEYYALRGDGKRMPKDTGDFRVIICTTHPDVLRISAERTLRWIGLQSDRKFFNISQGDDHTWCRCQPCLALDYEEGNHSDRMLYWVNHIAREVAKKYPDKTLVTYAYGPTQRAPVKVKPEKNVVIAYCAWPNKGSCPCGIRDFDAPENVVARTQILDWLKVAPGQVGLYDYNAGSRLTLYGMAWKVRWCAAHGMCGFHYCGGNKMFESLFRYVHGHLNWNPLLEVNRLKNDFITAFYGQAAPCVRELFDLIYDRLEYGDYDAEMGAGGYPPGRFYDREFVDRAFTLFDRALQLTQGNEAAHKDVAQTKSLFIKNCFRLCPGRSSELTDDQYSVFARNLREYLEWDYPRAHEERVANAKKRRKEPPDFSYKSIVGRIWGLTFVRVEMGEDETKLPPLVVQLMKDPKSVIEKHRKTYFVEKIADGWRVPAIQFTGGRYWPKYRWKCEAKDGAIVRGTMTELSRMQAEFVIEEPPPDRDGVVEADGQDSDKLWCAPVEIQILINKRKIFQGPNDFAKQGWSRRTWRLPKGTLKKGQNLIEVRNLASSDSLISHWFMLSEMLLRFPEE